MNGSGTRAWTSCILFLLCAQFLRAETHPETDWFKEAHMGVFIHVLPQTPEEFALLKMYDVEALATQLKGMDAKYVIFTLYQNEGYLNAPNATYCHYTTYAPGEKCSTRDLPLALYRALNPKGIKLMLYATAQVPNKDARAQKTFGLPTGPDDQPIDAEFARKWAEVIQEWSDRYRDKVAGWWMDGCYQRINFNEDLAKIYAAALRHANRRTLVTFNPGVKVPLVRATRLENYTAGELQEPFTVLPAARWLDGVQWHALTHLGTSWNKRDTRYSTARWIAWVNAVTDKGGVVTLDMGPNWDPQAGSIGTLGAKQAHQFKAISAALGRSPRD